MPKVRTPDDEARAILFRTSFVQLARLTGQTRQTMANRKAKPWNITLDELGAMVNGQDITDEELIRVIRSRGKLTV